MAHITTLTRAYNDLHNSQANTYSYSGSFETFKESEVKVTKNDSNVITTLTYNSSPSDNTQYSVNLTDKTIHVGGANLASGTLSIFPVTDLGDPTLKAPYSAGSAITASDITNNQLQVMRRQMEFDEKKLDNNGGTMTGDLAMGEDTKIIFEGATADAHETTLTVTDPTADRTITLPNVTGTVVTTGDTGTVATAMIAGDAITGAKIADDQINSEHYVDGSIDTAHYASSSVDATALGSSAVTTAKINNLAVTTGKIADSNVTTAKIAADNITSALIADDQINSEHYVDGSIDTAHIADSQITSAKIADGTIVAGDLASNAVTTVKITDANVTTAKIADSNVTTAKINADAVTNAKIADDSIDSEHYVDGSIDTAHIAGAQVTDAKLASNSVITSKITDANVTTVKIADSNVTLGKLASDLKQTTISNSDTQLPTSGAVVDYVAAQLLPFGGFEAVATEVAFPNTQPASGVIVSISDAAGVVVSGSGVSTTGRTVGGSTVTINNFPSSLNGETLASGVGLMVSSTGSSQIYNYHKILAAETDVKQLSDDINDFNARYRVGSSNPTSALDGGDLFFNTSTSKLLVYNNTNSAWEEAQSIGNFFISTFSEAFDGSRTQFTLSNAPANVQQIILSLNGVVQKPGTAFTLSGSTVTLASAPASGTDYFAVVMGSTVNIGTPSDGTVDADVLTSGAVTTAKIADDAVTAAKLASNAVVNASVDASAAIAGSKISPDFGSQNIVTTGGLTVDTSTLHVDSSNNRVGIGTTSAVAPLHVAHSGTNTAVGTNFISLRSGASGRDIGIQFADGATSAYVGMLGGAIYFADSGSSEKMRIDSAGRLLLGTTTEGGVNADDLTVANSGHAGITIRSGTSSVGSLYFSDGTSGADEYRGAVQYNHTDNYLRFYSDATERMRIDSVGNVGIGISSIDNSYSASHKLQIASVSDNNWGGSLVLSSADGSSVFSRLVASTNGLDFINTKATNLRFFTSNTERMRISSSGNFLVGRTGTINVDGQTCNHVFEQLAASNFAVGLHCNNSTQRGIGIYYTSGKTASDFMFCEVAGSIKFELKGNGGFANIQSNDVNLSDVSVKKNITDAASTIDQVKQWKIKEFHLTDDEDSDDKRFGVVAQDIETVDPKLVTEYGSNLKGVKEQQIYWKAIKSLQEAIAKIETLETKVAALEAA